MTKKDYIRIAKVFRQHQPLNTSTAEYFNWYATVRDMANELAEDNAKFDRSRFMIACGMSS